MKIYYDGNSISKYKSFPSVVGFTSNTSFASQSGYSDYKKYIIDYLAEADGKPCSFQIWSDDDDEILRQSKEISSLGSNIFVKIPIIKTDGSDNFKVISRVLDEGFKVNVTAIHTIDQIDLVGDLLPRSNQMIVSVFAGGITDSGRDPKPIMTYAVKKFKNDTNVEILWAGCQTNLHLVEARDCGCQIITIPDSIMNKMDRMNLDLESTSLNKVKKFMEDAASVTIKF